MPLSFRALRRRASFARTGRHAPIACALATLLALAGCGEGPAANDRDGTSATATPVSLDATTLRRGNGPEPDSLDPQLARTDAAFNILRDLFEGLTAVGPDGAAVPAAAESWTVSPDGREYRFALRKGLAWSNGDPLVAADYVAGMRRLVDPRTASPYAQFIGPVLHADAIARGERRPEELGVVALDARTLVVRLAAPAPYLVGLLAQPPTFPVHAPSLAIHGAAYSRPGKLVSNGAFVLQDWTFVRDLSPESRYFRFHTSLPALTPEMTERFIHLDYPDQMALIACVGSGENERQIGVARYARSENGGTADLGIAIADAWQGKGLAPSCCAGCRPCRSGGHPPAIGRCTLRKPPHAQPGAGSGLSPGAQSNRSAHGYFVARYGN